MAAVTAKTRVSVGGLSLGNVVSYCRLRQKV